MYMIAILMIKSSSTLPTKFVVGLPEHTFNVIQDEFSYQLI